MPKFFIFGDSLAYGKWDTELNGWASRLRRLLDEKVMEGGGYFETFNFGIPGDDSRGLFDRFDSDFRPRFKDGDDCVIIFQIGINDTQFIAQNNILRASKKDFETRIEYLIDLSWKYTTKIAFIGISPINEEQSRTVPWYRDDYYKNQSIIEYNGIIKNVCEKRGVQFLDIFEKLNDSRYIDTLVDGIHPNSKGHERIFRVVKDFLIEKKFL